MKKVEITKLKTPYVNVEGSYGGNQGWFKQIEPQLDVKESKSVNESKSKSKVDSRGLSARKAKTIQGFGCGLIGGSDILLHLFGMPEIIEEKSGNINKKESSAKSEGTTFSREEYENYILQMEKKFFHILPKLGISGILLAFNLNLYFLLNRRRIKKEKGSTYRARWAVLPRNILPRIKEMLSNDIPVVIAIGPGFFRKNKVIFYNKIEEPSRVVFKPVTKTKDHYVTVTGLEEYPEQVMLEISSWGKKYYVNYNEYLEYVKKNDNFYFSNILYIKKH
ncbi:hypothetical protein SAMN02910369_01242 [Lachnospiraceae bacterium NE2001]|nr:hypothetical protein SAMN02910369_01242 [Lachnospiraceae bacterium NE2001]